jgi:hypothetical protein
MPYKSIANLALVGQSLALAGNAFPYAGNKKKKKKKLVKTAVESIVGASMIKSTANILGTL